MFRPVSFFVSIIKRVIPLPSLVPSWIKRAVINPVISLMRREGHPAATIDKAIKDTGAQVEEPRYGQDLKKFISMAELGDATRAWNKGKVFPQRLMVEAELSRGARYRIYGEAYILNNDTDEIFYQNMSFYDESRRTPDEYGDEVIHRYLGKGTDKNLTLIEFNVSHVVHNKGFSY